MHAPLMTLLGKGTLRLDTAEGEKRFGIEGGFLQIIDDQVRVVTEHATAISAE
jgi:F-type H+-transporting ATPase subunit epsilon